jgi:hypothetical protein
MLFPVEPFPEELSLVGPFPVELFHVEPFPEELFLVEPSLVGLSRVELFLVEPFPVKLSRIGPFLFEPFGFEQTSGPVQASDPVQPILALFAVETPELFYYVLELL